MSTWASSSIMTYVALFNDDVRSAVRKRCGISLTGYRALAYLENAPSATPGELAGVLEAKPSTISGVLGELTVSGLAIRPSGPRGIAAITDFGRERLDACDLVLVDVVAEFFEGAPPTLKGEVLSGSIATAVQHGVARMRNGAYFREYACLYGFSLSELIFKKSAYTQGLSFGELRVLTEIHDSSKVLNAEAMREHLIMGKSEASRYIDDLVAKDLVERAPFRGDNRSSALVLTNEAEPILQAVRDSADLMNREKVRPSNEDEIAFSKKLAEAIVDGRRTKQHNRGRK